MVRARAESGAGSQAFGVAQFLAAQHARLPRAVRPGRHRPHRSSPRPSPSASPSLTPSRAVTNGLNSSARRMPRDPRPHQLRRTRPRPLRHRGAPKVVARKASFQQFALTRSRSPDASRSGCSSASTSSPRPIRGHQRHRGVPVRLPAAAPRAAPPSCGSPPSTPPTRRPAPITPASPRGGTSHEHTACGQPRPVGGLQRPRHPTSHHRPRVGGTRPPQGTREPSPTSPSTPCPAGCATSWPPSPRRPRPLPTWPGALPCRCSPRRPAAGVSVHVRGPWREPTNLYIAVALPPATARARCSRCSPIRSTTPRSGSWRPPTPAIVEAEVTARLAKEAADKAAAKAANAEPDERDALMASRLGSGTDSRRQCGSRPSRNCSQTMPPPRRSPPHWPSRAAASP